MSRTMGSYLDYDPANHYYRRIFKYEVITPLSAENLKAITNMINRNDIMVRFVPTVMGASYYALIDSTGKVLGFSEFESSFDRPCEAYHIYLGDYKGTEKPQKIASLNCWFQDVKGGDKIKRVIKKVPEKQILDIYASIESKYKNPKVR